MKNRHELPRKKPGRSAKDEIDEELPTLEAIGDDLPTLPLADGELPTLEAVDAPPKFDDGPFQIALPGGEGNFDTVFAITVPGLDKKAIADALPPVLQRRFAAAPGQLRHRRVLVRFSGDGVIGTASKDKIGELLKPHSPLLAVVRRGYGDETVHTGKLPEVKVASSEQGGATRVEIATGELDAIDLPIALATHLPAIVAAARGKRLTFTFTGKAKPDAALRQELQQKLEAAGALRAAIGERVLFDRELADRVRCTVVGEQATVRIDPAADDASTLDALAMVLPAHAAAVRGKTLRIELARPSASARDAAIEFGKKSGSGRIEVASGGEVAIVWPKLIAIGANAGETVLRLVPNGRDRAAVVRALRDEATEQTAATKGKAVVVDWPAGTVVDGEVEKTLHDVGKALAAKSLAATVAGEEREPLLPPPVTFTVDGDRCVVRIDSEAGKPAELQRAFDRRFGERKKELHGKAVRVQVAGKAALSRSLARSVATAIEAAGAMRLEIEEGGAIDVLLPPLLTIAKAGDQVRIGALVEGRDQAQQQKALARELAAVELPATAVVTIGHGAAAEAVAAAVVQKGAARVVLDGASPVAVHPPLFAVEKKGTQVRLAATPFGDPAMQGRQLDRELPALLSSLGLLATSTVNVVWPGAVAEGEPFRKLLSALLGKKVPKVLLDAGLGAVQVHPAPVAAASPKAPAPAPAPVATASGASVPPTPLKTTIPVAAAPAASNPAAVASLSPGSLSPGSLSGGLLRVLARNDEAVPPTVVVGIETGGDAGSMATHAAAVEAQLQENLPRFQRRSVLLVLQRAGIDVPVRKADPLVDALLRTVPSAAAATLVFRGPDAQGRPHFQVVHSSLRALPVGATFGDPRVRR
jgi:hypothetical protein